MQFGILVPMRSEEGSTIQTVAETLFRLIHELRRDRDARFQVFVGYDEDDQLLAETRAQKAITENIAYLLNTSVASSTYDPSRQFPQTDELQAAELVKWERLPSPDSPGRGFAACVAWDHLARLAFAEGCDLSLLLGDDICIIRPTNWSQQIAGKFKEAHLENGAPFGAAMVGVLEESAPGWPCFLAIHRWHVETFGELFPVRGPNAFFNQDADPFLWEVYRRFGLSRWTDEVILNNTKGGVRGGLQKIASPTRYEPVHIEWRTGLLQRYQEKLQASLPRGKEMERVTMDIAVPSFRVEPVYLRRILQLRSSFPEKLQIRFVLIIDRPLEELPKTTVAELRQMERQQRDVRIRVNSRNMGAPASRTRALRDCHSKWILFLDDDVLPDEAILDEYLEGILSAEEKPKKVSGFVGVTELDYLPQQSVMAVHLAQSTFFWRISELCASENLPVPWGVTANLLLRWDPQLSFDEQFPKTGGGEDIDICIRAGGAEGKLLAAPRARVRHPWWDDGKRLNLWRRLFLWAQGDGMLQSKYPEYTYRSFPNIWEVSLVILLLFAFSFLEGKHVLPLLLVVWTSELVGGTLWIYLKRVLFKEYPPGNWRHFFAALESSAARNASELGHIVGHLGRGQVLNLGRRFDWFLGQYRYAVPYERWRGCLLFGFHVLGVLFYYLLASAGQGTVFQDL